MKRNIASVLKYFLSILLAAALLYFAFRGIDWREFVCGLKSTRWGYIIISMLVACIALVLRAERWREQLIAIDPEVSRSRIWHGSNVGNLLSLIIPGIGEFYRCAHVGSQKSGYDRTFGTIIMERAWDIVAIVFLLVIAVFTNTDKLVPFMRANVIEPFAGRFDFSLWWVIAVLAVLGCAAIFAVFRFSDRNEFCAKCAKMARGVVQGVLAFKKMRHKWLFLIYTAGIWVMYILMTYFTFLAVPELSGLGFFDSTFISAVGNIASVIPTPGNLGAYHYLVGMAISDIYLSVSSMSETALLCATLSHGSHAALLLILGLWSYLAIAIKRD